MEVLGPWLNISELLTGWVIRLLGAVEDYATLQQEHILVHAHLTRLEQNTGHDVEREQ